GFRATDRAGTRFYLGTTEDGRIPGVDGPWAWLLESVEDNLGNRATFTWRRADRQRYLDRVAYGPYELRLEYEGRPDPLRWARGGFLLLTEERCAAIELHLVAAANSRVRRWSLQYSAADPNGASLLASITLTGFGADGGALDAPPLRFGYTQPRPARLDRILASDERSAPPGLSTRGRVEFIDWTGDGAPDLLEVGVGGAARVWPNGAGEWGRPFAVGDLPQLAPPSARAALADLDGDGMADLVRADRPPIGYQPRTADGFGRSVVWERSPSIALSAASTRLADLDGDGIVDLIWSNGRALLLSHRSEEQGWESLPEIATSDSDDLPVALDDPHVFMADMTGDGSPDLVRVDGSGVVYWSYLGGGRFGDMVTMANPPSFPFYLDPERLFVID